jgi:hypothetical protein
MNVEVIFILFSDESVRPNPLRPGVQTAQPPGGRLLRPRVPRFARNIGESTLASVARHL